MATEVSSDITKMYTSTPPLLSPTISVEPSDEEGGKRRGKEREVSEDATNDDEGAEYSDDDDEHGVPSLKLPASPPQLASLSLPSPIFSHSVFDLLSPLPTHSPGASTRSGSRVRSGSTLSHTSTYSERRFREPTLNFAHPRESVDSRVRKQGKEEDVWFGIFPDEELALPGAEEDLNWTEASWRELGDFLAARGYKIDEVGPKEVDIKASRISDQLPLTLRLVPVDDAYEELDILEHMSSFSIRSSSSHQGVITTVPVVGLVPLSESWMAVVTERWDNLVLTKLTPNELPRFVRDIVGATAFLHSQHIALLSLSPSNIATSNSHGTPRYAFKHFSASIQCDPLSPDSTLVTGVPFGIYSPTEMNHEVPFDAFAADCYSLGMVLKEAMKETRVANSQVEELIKTLTLKDPKSRGSVAAVWTKVKEIFP